MTVTLTLLALLVELVFGYPSKLFAAIGHPVTWIGAVIAWFDRRWNRGEDAPMKRRNSGLAALVLLVLIAAGTGIILQLALAWMPFGLLALAVLTSSLFAQRSLHDHVAAVATALETEGLPAARVEVAKIVGRDTETLDEPGITRAAIESLAENYSDGVVAPAFWLAVGGLPAAAAYKAVNTADSMIGHRTPRHQDFGRATARFDDLINLPASRLTALLFTAAAIFLPGASAAKAWAAARRDGPHHRSPNAGWAEAALAGALGIAIAGPRMYGGKMVQDAMMGDGGRRELDAKDIRRALLLYWIADALLLAILGGLALVFSLHVG